MEETSYRDFEKCIRLTNGSIELITTVSVGPRIIRCGFIGHDNLFGEPPDISMRVGDDSWHIYGGHRLWHSPEINPRTYSPDNSPVQAEMKADTLHLTQDTEAMTGIQKELEITLSDSENRVQVLHRMTNRGVWPINLAAWALTVMNREGLAIIPQPQGDREALLPNWGMTLWPYTDMSDPRVRWGREFITLQQEPEISPRFKIGLRASSGWVGYLRKNQLFVKRFTHQPEADYPDWGCSLEVFTNEAILEIESLSPLTTLHPGQELEHVEQWFLFDGVPSAADDASIEQNICPLVSPLLSRD